MDILKLIEENSEKYKNKEMTADGLGTSLSYGEYYELSGRVYAYLKNKGIGPEEFVLISLPRDVRPLACVCGVLRSGAAFVMVEDDLPAERIEYIRRDCSCKLVIDENIWQDILRTGPIGGYEARTEHSAAFAVYTSGTTGNPKGVVHEYGNIERMVRSAAGFDLREQRFVLCSPLNFVASVLSLFLCLAGAFPYYIIPFSILKDPMRLHAYILENKIATSFLSPMFVKKMEPILSSFTFCMVGSEPANELFSDKFPIYNIYTMSEVGFIAAIFLIDKPYPNTPAGNSLCGYPIRLVDEEGNEVPEGEKGEIVLENPFVRGYINLPERTAEVFKNGWYYTGDLGMWDEKHRLVVCGRLDDMEKVNGNRIEPGEIEFVSEKVLGLSWAAAKVFHDNGRPVVCLYYTDKVELDPEAAREKLKEKLPYYMIPAFFMHIDQIPFTPAGKFNRRGLPSPLSDHEDKAYRAPENAVQKALCDAFAAVFHIARAGMDDDFTQLGGDSLNAMEVVVSSGLDGLSVTDILSGGTPFKIAELYAKHAVSEDTEEINASALKKDYPLTDDQAYIVKWQLKEPKSTMRSIHTLMKFDKHIINMKKMAAAVDAAARNHPSLYTEIFYAQNGELRQRFNKDILKETVTEELSEDEFNDVKASLIQPFTMINTPLFRSRVFETEEAGYLFVDVHHTVFDGASYNILLSDIIAAYTGKEMAEDYYPYILETKGCLSGSDGFEESRKYFENRYGKKDWCRHPEITGEAKESEIGVITSVLPVTDRQLRSLEKQNRISRNVFFASAAACAYAACDKKDNIMLFWTFNGRTDKRELHSVGNLRSSLPVAFEFENGISAARLYQSAAEQIHGGIAHCRYSYLEQHPEFLDEGVIRVLYQGSFNNASSIPGFSGMIPLTQTNTVSRAFINLEITDQGDKEFLTLKYTVNSFSASFIQTFAKVFGNAVEELAGNADDLSLTSETLL